LGVAPAIIIYFWGLAPLKSLGWIAALLFAICACLRLARFNVMLEDKNTPKWHKSFFLGVPAPAGAMLVLAPLYVQFISSEFGFELTKEYRLWLSPVIALYLSAIGLLLVSNIRTFSGKEIGAKINRNLALPLMLGAVVIVMLLFSYPWEVLTIISLIYLASIPFSHMKFNRKSKAEA
jgi:CDP-diacylglycerol--serine O-phosphatidyltransferase